MSLPAWAAKGRAIVCVRAFPINPEVKASPPVVGETYTILYAWLGDTSGRARVLLKETATRDMETCPIYWLSHFRPVVTAEEDVAIFAPLLNVKHMETV